MISEHNSQVIERIKFPFAIMVIMLHSFTTVEAPANGFAWNIIYIFSFIFGEMGVPCFFFISGLLFFRKIDNSNFSFKNNINKRIYSLLIPYLIWNTLMIMFYAIGQNINSISGFFSGVIPDMSNISLMDFLRFYWDRGDWNGGNSMPILTPLWYVRNLFFVSLISPVLYLLLKYSKGLVLLIFFYVWLTENSVAFSEVSIFFFSIGAWCSIIQFDFTGVSNKFKSVTIASFIILGVLDFYFHTVQACPYNLIIHRLTLFTGTYSIILFVSRYMTYIVKIRAVPLAKYSFFIYLSHYPAMLALRKAEMKFITSTDPVIQLALYFSSIIIVVGILIVLYKFLDRFVPTKLFHTLVPERVVNR